MIATSLTRTPQPAGARNGVATMPLRSRNPLWIEDSARYPGPVRLANKAATILNLRTASQLGELLDTVRPDVLHTHSMVELPPAVWARAQARGVAVVHTLHDFDLLCIRGALFKDGRRCEPRHLACRLLSAPKRAAHHHIDAVAAVSAPVLDRHLQHGLFAHLPEDRRRTIWNPAVPPAADARRAGRLPGAAHRFGFLGRLVSQKGLGVLIEACRRLPQAGWTLTIAGAGPEEAGFHAAAAGLPIEFVGHVTPATYLAGVDTLVTVPIWDEPFGLTTLEGYAAGCRVIGADVGVIGAFIARVDPGWTVASGDVDALVDAMVRAMAAHTPVSVERARSLLDELAPTLVAERYVCLYEDALTARRNASREDTVQ